ncbi:ABC transporter ATP-binding protein [Geobacter benzoatilyticus]|uniref:ABC transporter ATP-binding protein n=1 Tax=Geobacter benzoatilyticus TaxID=2815309 RepID=A0ABX7Q1E1_9BACT|nr:ABC transporter ATP-binding protein [Geobacter benzoatilyticus]QSV44931.1 ABC transporter ATP-binding protein [Geobacter benzoatilyticus]
MAAIEIDKLCKVFRTKKFGKVEALSDLSLTIASGEVYGFLGPNGAGKSTTIKTIMGLIAPTSGTARIMGQKIESPQARAHIGYLPENPAFYDYLTAEEYLKFVGRSFKMSDEDIAVRSEATIKLLDLWEARRRPIRGYSKGMVQRVGLAQALIHDPDVFILDEPMSGLDPVGRALVKEIILELKKAGKTVFFSTHITDDVEKVCDRVGVIVGGKLQYDGNVEELLRDGTEGYVLQVRNIPEGLSCATVSRAIAHGVVEIVLKREDLNKSMTELVARGGSIERIEPQRKNLESFFLDILKKKGNR